MNNKRIIGSTFALGIVCFVCFQIGIQAEINRDDDPLAHDVNAEILKAHAELVLAPELKKAAEREEKIRTLEDEMKHKDRIINDRVYKRRTVEPTERIYCQGRGYKAMFTCFEECGKSNKK